MSEAHLKTSASYSSDQLWANSLFRGWWWSDAYPPVRIDAAAAGHASHGHDDVHDEEDEGQEHAEYHDGESGACLDQSQ